jgi:hypothetical protein
MVVSHYDHILEIDHQLVLDKQCARALENMVPCKDGCHSLGMDHRKAAYKGV